jgi:hypothetical protein
MARKLKWYSALGVDVVVRPRGASAIKDAAAYLKVLRQNQILAITPDLLTTPDAGIGVEICGRPGKISGAFAIASIARAPLLRPFPRWQSDSRVILSWASVDLPSDDQNRTAVIAGAAQDWRRWFERKLRSQPRTGYSGWIKDGRVFCVPHRSNHTSHEYSDRCRRKRFGNGPAMGRTELRAALCRRAFDLAAALHNAAAAVRWTGRAMIQISWLLILLAVPFALS